MKKSICVLFVCFILSACGGGGSGSSGANSGCSTDVIPQLGPALKDQVWSGNWETNKSNSGQSGSLSNIRFAVSGSALGVSGYLGGSNCFSSVAMNGTLSGNQLSFSDRDIKLTGCATGHDGYINIRGSYSVGGSTGCSGDYGTFILTTNI